MVYTVTMEIKIIVIIIRTIKINEKNIKNSEN